MSRTLLLVAAGVMLVAVGLLVMVKARPAKPGCEPRAGGVIELFAPGLKEGCR